MAQTRRAQVLMEPDEYERLSRLARKRRVSVAALVRAAVREKYFSATEDPRQAAKRITRLNLPVIEWHEIDQLLGEESDERLP